MKKKVNKMGSAEGGNGGGGGGEGPRRRWGVILGWSLVVFVLFEVVVQMLQDESLAQQMEKMPAYSTLNTQRENVAKERMRIKVAKDLLKRREEALRKEFEDLGQAELYQGETDRCNSNCERNDAHYYEYLVDHVVGDGFDNETERNLLIQKNAKLKDERKLKTRLFLGIFTETHEESRRNTIRNTLMRMLPSSDVIVIRFIVCAPFLESDDKDLQAKLSTEQNFYKDIVLFDESVIDKSVLGDSNIVHGGEKMRLFYNYVYENYIADYVMKINGDTFIKLDNLMTTIDSLPKRWVYWGAFTTGLKVMNDDTYLDLNDRYPTFSTPFSIISRDVLMFIVLSPIEVNRWANPDATLGTWLSPLGLIVVDVPPTATWRLTPICVKCYCEEDAIVIVYPVHSNSDYEELYKGAQDSEMCELSPFKNRIRVGKLSSTFKSDQLFKDNNRIVLFLLFGSSACCFVVIGLIVCQALRRAFNADDSDDEE